MEPIFTPSEDLPTPPTDRRTLLAGLGGLAAGAMLTRSARAGDLNPPAGPIAPTMKKLDEVEPRTPINTLPGSSNSVHRILLPGSYYLTGDIVGETGKSGIQVISLADEVVIDLNGFTIRGVGGSLVGISCNGTTPRVVIRNGQIRGWGSHGVNAVCPIVLEDLRIEGNGQGGATGGPAVAAIARRCVFAGNTAHGLSVGLGSRVERVVCQSNGQNGIVAGARTMVLESQANQNTGHGIIVGDRAGVVDCMCAQNTQNGIDADFGSTVTASHCSLNQRSGIRAGEACVITGSTSDSNWHAGFEITRDMNRCEANTAAENLIYQFRFDGSRNLITRNLAMGDNEFSFDSPSSLSASLVGPSWTTVNSANSSNPHANYRL
jgi:hypothetical protein